MAFWARFFGNKAGNTTSANTTSTRALEARDDDGFTALHRACLGAHHPIEEAEQLIAGGADVNARVSDVSVNRHRKQGWTPLHFAALSGIAGGGEQVDKIRLLISHGAKLEAIGTSAGETPLHLAISSRASASVETLVQSGANVHACLVNGLTAIEMAIKIESSSSIIKELIERGARLDLLDRIILPGDMTKWADSVLGQRLMPLLPAADGRAEANRTNIDEVRSSPTSIRYVLLVVSHPTAPTAPQTAAFLMDILPELDTQHHESTKIGTLWVTTPIAAVDMAAKAAEAFGPGIVNNEVYTYRTLQLKLKEGDAKCLVVYDKAVNSDVTPLAAPSNAPDPVIPPDPVMDRHEAMMNATASAYRAELDDSIQFLYDAKCITGIWLAFFPTNTTNTGFS
jgi:hypothetical protein